MDIEKRLAAVEARFALSELRSKYCWYTVRGLRDQVVALFTDDGTYWVPAVPDQQSPFNQASLFYDDRELMKTRVDRLEHPRIHVQTPPSRTAHLVGNMIVEQAGDGEFLVRSTFIMVEYRDDRQRTFAGRQQHRSKSEREDRR